MFEFLGFILIMGLVWAFVALFPWMFLAVGFVAIAGAFKANNDMASPFLFIVGVLAMIFSGLTLIFHITPMSILHFTLNLI